MNSLIPLDTEQMKSYFSRPGFTLYQGDCLEVLRHLKPESVDMIFADPPYNLSNDGFTCQGGRMVSVNKGNWDKSKGVENDFAFHTAWIEACRKVLKPNGTIWISGTYHSIYQCGFALQTLGYHILNDVAWFKPNAAPNLSCRFFTASHETLIWARRDKKAKHTFNYKLMKEGDWHNHDQIKKPGLQMRTAWVVPEIVNDNENGKGLPAMWSIGTPKRSEKEFGKHPTQKPVTLLDRVVLASTNKNDVILDPFAGSSTTGIAAARHGRKFIGIEMDKKYLDLSIKRFDAVVKSVPEKIVG